LREKHREDFQTINAVFASASLSFFRFPFFAGGMKQDIRRF